MFLTLVSLKIATISMPDSCCFMPLLMTLKSALISIWWLYLQFTILQLGCTLGGIRIDFINRQSLIAICNLNSFSVVTRGLCSSLEMNLQFLLPCAVATFRNLLNLLFLFCFFPFPRYPGSASETNSDDIAEWAQPWSLVAKCLTTVVFCANTTI